ncbi:hypothetical protein RGR602_CH02306 [Rhizobium gallicum bv. gallicum R602sp]|uniref:Uncharacterized protein n=1 Tax=Rhizobium gallicum bv. gallicum R602sp TaxID=1041138 RepID=A0A0B4X550_9HYPH|nr:hypothetical protein [Rhizobium gallicum]AJD41632.1 hypothetical protein RGR602_CH02306 [Rhizobium gallicum bv. gallicum R602sp]
MIETGAAASVGNLGNSTRGDDPSAIVDLMERGGFNECQWKASASFQIISMRTAERSGILPWKTAAPVSPPRFSF